MKKDQNVTNKKLYSKISSGKPIPNISNYKASGTHTEWILNRDKKHNKIYQKVTKKLLQRQNFNSQTNSRFTPATNLKIGRITTTPKRTISNN